LKNLSLASAGLVTREQERLNILSQGITEDDDVRGTNRREFENERYKNVCSEVLPGFLYLGSDLVARNKELLLSNKITHVINCAGDYSPEYFSDIMSYKTFHLKDSPRENIECCFYDSIFFINQALMSNGRVYVHCVQGVSRSATICMAYLIFDKKMTYNGAFELLQASRPVANPNLNFIAQLMWWHKRLYEPFNSIPVSPRVYAVGSHQIEQPGYIVCRLLMDHLYINKNSKSLDPRGVFIVESVDEIILWMGSECQYRKKYLEVANSHIKILQAYEKAPKNLKSIEHGKEPESFWKLWQIKVAPHLVVDKISEWDSWYIDIEQAENEMKQKECMVYEQEEDIREIEETRKYKPHFYTYPDSKDPITVFDLEALEVEDAYYILCIRQEHEAVDEMHIWRGPDFDKATEDDLDRFRSEVTEHLWGEEACSRKIEVKNEIPGQESEEFLNYFD